MEVIGISPEVEEAFTPLIGGKLGEDEVALGVVEDDRAVGAVVFHAEQASICIDHIYISKKCRRKKAAHALMEKLYENARAVDVYVIEAQLSDKDKGLIAFLKSEGFVLTESGEAFSVPTESLLASRELHRLTKDADKDEIRRFSELSDNELNKLNNELINKGELPEGFKKGEYDENLSVIVCDKFDHSYKGSLVVARGDKDIVILYLINFTSDTSVLFQLLAGLRNAVIKEHAADGFMQYLIVDPKVDKIMDMILPDREAIMEKQKMLTAIKVI